MSIYASFCCFDDGENAAPILYKGSHILPHGKSERGGHFGLGAIPGHISRRGRKALSDDFHPYWPWLRVSLNETMNDCHTVVLTKQQVTKLRDALNEWLKLAERK